jgi:hypothetical protein
LNRRCRNFQLPQVKKKALTQIHCHRYALLDVEPEKKIMGASALDYEAMHSGFRGMAGSVGFESGKYNVSMKAGDRASQVEFAS